MLACSAPRSLRPSPLIFPRVWRILGGKMDDNTFATTIAARLRTARERCGLSQKEVADRLQVTPQAYGNWERGARGVPLELLPTFTRVLGRSIAWLLDLDIGLTEDEDELVTLYRSIRDPAKRRLALEIVEKIARSDKSG